MRNYIFGLIIFLISMPSFAKFSYEGVLLNPDGSAVEHSNVKIRLKVRTTNNCALYEEFHQLDMSGSEGYFSVIAGSGTGGIVNHAGTSSFDTLFVNGPTYNGLPLCDSGTDAVTSAGDLRKMSVEVSINNAAYEDFGSIVISQVPTASVAEKLANHSVGSLLRFESAGTPSAVAALPSGDFSVLTALLGGTSTLYTKNSAADGTVLVSSATDPGSAAAGSMWLDSVNDVIKFKDDNGIVKTLSSGGATDATYGAKGVVQIDTDAATSGLSIASGVLKLPTTGAAGTYGSASSVPAITVDAFGRITSVTDTTIALNASAISAGVLPIVRGGTNSGTALSNNRIMVSSGGAIVEAAALTNGQILIGSTGAAPVAASLSAGAGISITPSAGGISIAATGGTGTLTDLTGDVTASGSGSVAATIANSAVTSAKILDGTIAATDLANDAVTTAKIQDGSVTLAKIANITDNKILGRSAGSNGPIQELTISTGLSVTSGYLAVDATSTNTASKIVKRDGSGNFVAEAGTFNTSVSVTDGAVGGSVTIAVPVGLTSYNLTLPYDAGNNYQVLQTNGSGVLSWATMPPNASALPVGAIASPSLSFTGSPGTGLSLPSADTLAVSSSGQQIMKVVPNAVVVNNPSASPTKLILENDAGQNSDLFFIGNGGTLGMKVSYNQTNSRLEVGSVSGGVSTAMVVNRTDGRVGIGTTGPMENLHVVGNIRTDGQQYSNAIVVAGVSSVDFNSGNTQVIENPSAAGIALSNVKHGARYTLIIKHTSVANTYTFAGDCAVTKYSAINSSVTAGNFAVYDIRSVVISSVMHCFVSGTSYTY